MYLLVEKLKYATYRRLMKRVQLLHAESNPAKGFQLPLGAPPPVDAPTHDGILGLSCQPATPRGDSLEGQLLEQCHMKESFLLS